MAGCRRAEWWGNDRCRGGAMGTCATVLLVCHWSRPGLYAAKSAHWLLQSGGALNFLIRLSRSLILDHDGSNSGDHPSAFTAPSAALSPTIRARGYGVIGSYGNTVRSHKNANRSRVRAEYGPAVHRRPARSADALATVVLTGLNISVASGYRRTNS
jgi:hypothetical protein